MTIAQRDAGEKPTEKTNGDITNFIVSHPNTVKFTEALEMPLRVQNFEGKIVKGYHRTYRAFLKLKRYIRRLLNNNILLKGF